MQLLECGKKVSKKKKKGNGRKLNLCFMCGHIQEITNISFHNSKAFTFHESSLHHPF